LSSSHSRTAPSPLIAGLVPAIQAAKRATESRPVGAAGAAWLDHRDKPGDEGGEWPAVSTPERLTA